MLDYDIPRVHVDKDLHLRNKFKPEYINKIVEISKEKIIYFDQLFQGKGSIFL